MYHDHLAAAQLELLNQARVSFEEHYPGLLPVLRAKHIGYQFWTGGPGGLTVVFDWQDRQLGLPLRKDGGVRSQAGEYLAAEDLLLEVVARTLGARAPRRWGPVKWALAAVASAVLFLYFCLF